MIVADAEGLKVILVGHCGPDSHLLKRAVADAVPGATVAMNAEEKSLWNSAAHLLLVNRVLDGWYADDSGLRLIAEAKERGVPALLISNYADAQAASVAAGGAPGFGKREARTDKATRAIRGALKLD
jgi:hypothetical protein